jgi:hypothetical protein
MLSHPGGSPQSFTQVMAVPELREQRRASSAPSADGRRHRRRRLVGRAAAERRRARWWRSSAALAPGVVSRTSATRTIFFYFGRFARSYHAFAPFLEAPPPLPENEYFTDPGYPGLEVPGRDHGGRRADPRYVRENVCIPETVCVSGALPGRAEVFLRVVGPRPNGKLWPTLVKFTTSRVDVWIRQLSTGEEKHYTLEGASPGWTSYRACSTAVASIRRPDAAGHGPALRLCSS